MSRVSGVPPGGALPPGAEGNVLQVVDGEWSAAPAPDSLPEQDTHAGKVLTTNGSAASWTDTLSNKTLDGTIAASATATLDFDAALGVLVPTKAPGTNDTSAASTAFVAAAIAAGILPAYYTTAATGPTISGTGLQAYINVTTPSLAAGTYSIVWCVVSSHTAAASTQGVVLTAGGATQVPTGPIDGPSSQGSGSKTSVHARGTYVHAGGTLSLLVQVRRTAGTGNIIPQTGSIELRRIA